MSSDEQEKSSEKRFFQKSDDKVKFEARHTAIKFAVLFAGILSAFYSIASVADIYWLLSAFYNLPGFLGLIASVGFFLIYVYIVTLKSDKSDLIKAEKSIYVDSSNITFGGSVTVKDLDGFNRERSVDEKPAVSLKKQSKSSISHSPSSDLEALPHLHTPFELYVNAIVKALDNRISLSEIKANLLLSQGKSLMAWGAVFYLIAIGAWQVIAHYWGYSYILLIGMVSCSLLFVVIEFLAAWFLKQYRSYIDSSMTYLQARSVYNNYLLTYYALNQFDENTDTKKILVKMLGEKITWPSVKELSKNDFNYMLESLSAFSGTLDKVKMSLGANKEAPFEKKEAPTEKKEETKTEPA